MAKLPSLADRTWFAYQCIPGKPSMSSLEAEVGLPHGTISKTKDGIKKHHEYDTMKRLARALRTTPEWLTEEEGEGPVPPPGVIVIPRENVPWKRYGDLTGWDQSVKLLLAEAAADGKERVPPEAFLAGGACAVYRPVDQVTPEIALAVASFAWELSTKAEQRHYTTLYRRPPRTAAALRKKTK